MLANERRAVLLTTSNRSEGDVGYATMDGDTSGSFAPIAGLSKVFILQWLRWAESFLGHEGLVLVNNLQPTAELRPLDNKQTDEDDLMPYKVLVEIEKHAIQYRRSPVEVFRLMKADHDPEPLEGTHHQVLQAVGRQPMETRTPRPCLSSRRYQCRSTDLVPVSHTLIGIHGRTGATTGRNLMICSNSLSGAGPFPALTILAIFAHYDHC